VVTAVMLLLHYTRCTLAGADAASQITVLS